MSHYLVFKSLDQALNPYLLLLSNRDKHETSTPEILIGFKVSAELSFHFSVI